MRLLMKNQGKFLLAFLAAGLMWAGPARADWVRDGSASLNVNSAKSAVNSDLVIADGQPCVIWFESPGIYVKKFNGLSWNPVGNSLNVNASAGQPSLINNDGVLYAAWCELNASKNQVYVGRFNGAQWVPLGGSLNQSPANNASSPCLACCNQTPYIVWQESNGSNLQIYSKFYNGLSWEPLGGCLNVVPGNGASSPRLDVWNGTPYAAWTESCGAVRHIYVKYFNGNDWEALGNTLNITSTEDADHPDIKVFNGTPFVAWDEYYTGYTRRFGYVKKYSTGNWVQVSPYTPYIMNTYNASNPRLAMAADGTPYLGYSEETGTAIRQTYVKRFMPVPSIDWFPLGASLNLNNSRNSNNPAITLNNDCPYVSWSEETSGATQLYVKHWATPTPTVTASPTVTPTSTASLTSTASPTSTASSTSTSSPTATASCTASITASNTPSPTSTGTATPTSTATASATLTSTPTFTRTASATPTHSPTTTETLTPTVSATFSWTPTAAGTASCTPTRTPSQTPCTLSPTPSATFSPTPRNDPTATATATPAFFHAGGRTVWVFPNPAGERVTLAWQETGAESVRAILYNVAGEQVAVLGAESPGSSLVWNTAGLASGVYFCQVSLRIQGQEKKLPLQKIAIRK